MCAKCSSVQDVGADLQKEEWRVEKEPGGNGAETIRDIAANDRHQPSPKTVNNRSEHRKNCECCPGQYLSTSVY